MSRFNCVSVINFIFFFVCFIIQLILFLLFSFSYISTLSDILYWRNLFNSIGFSYMIGMSIYCQYTVIFSKSFIVFNFFLSDRSGINVFGCRFSQYELVEFCCRLWNGTHAMDTMVLCVRRWRNYSGISKTNG